MLRKYEPVPEGFEPLPLDSGFPYLIGPLYVCYDDSQAWIIGLRATKKHSNRYGIVHGGLLSTLADIALGFNFSRVTSIVETTLTLNLSINFVGSAEEGDWLQAHVELNKTDGRVRFGECRVLVNGRMVARATAVFYAPGY